MRQWALAAITLLPSVAAAQLYTSDLELRRDKADATISDRVSVFVTGEFSQAKRNGSFNVATMGSNAGGASTAQLVFSSTGLAMTTWMPQIGMVYAFNKSFLLHAAVGMTAISLEDATTPSEFLANGYADQHKLIFVTDLHPGFAATLGGVLAIARFSNFTLTTGLRLSYSSAARVRSDAVTGTLSFAPAGGTGSSSTIDHVKTENVDLHTIDGKLSAGLEWRPRASYFSNHFGVIVGYGLAFGSMTRTTSIKVIAGTAGKTEISTDTVGFSMGSANIVGFYYGWSVFIPRIGSLGIEGRALNPNAVTLSYSYIF